jgi:hypothetical protein
MPATVRHCPPDFVHKQTSCFFGNTDTNGSATGRKALDTDAHLKDNEKSLVDTKHKPVEKRICNSQTLVRADTASTCEICPDFRFFMTAFTALKTIFSFNLSQIFFVIFISFKPIREL